MKSKKIKFLKPKKFFSGLFTFCIKVGKFHVLLFVLCSCFFFFN